MENKSALIFIDGTICDDRHRMDLYGTEEFYNEGNVMRDKPVAGSVDFVTELSKTYNIIYIGARPESAHFITQQWLIANGFPKGKLFLAPEQSKRVEIVNSFLIKENIVLGIGDRWDDNQLHLILDCKSVIVEEYHGDFAFCKQYALNG